MIRHFGQALAAILAGLLMLSACAEADKSAADTSADRPEPDSKLGAVSTLTASDMPRAAGYSLVARN